MIEKRSFLLSSYHIKVLRFLVSPCSVCFKIMANETIWWKRISWEILRSLFDLQLRSVRSELFPLNCESMNNTLVFQERFLIKWLRFIDANGENTWCDGFSSPSFRGTAEQLWNKWISFLISSNLECTSFLLPWVRYAFFFWWIVHHFFHLCVPILLEGVVMNGKDWIYWKDVSIKGKGKIEKKRKQIILWFPFLEWFIYCGW